MIISRQDFKTPSQVTSEFEAHERAFWVEWLFHSHRWIEYTEGHYECSWCNSIYKESSEKSLVQVCKRNPLIAEKKEKPHTWY